MPEREGELREGTLLRVEMQEGISTARYDTGDAVYG